MAYNTIFFQCICILEITHLILNIRGNLVFKFIRGTLVSKCMMIIFLICVQLKCNYLNDYKI